MTTSTKCRVCICSLDASVEFYDMRKLPRLAHKFVTCTDLAVSDEKRLPSELCQVCHDQLERLYAFRARCIASDTKWRMEILAFCEDTDFTEDDDQTKSLVEKTELKINSPQEAAEPEPVNIETQIEPTNATQIPAVTSENVSDQVSLQYNYTTYSKIKLPLLRFLRYQRQSTNVTSVQHSSWRRIVYRRTSDSTDLCHIPAQSLVVIVVIVIRIP